MYHQIAQGIRVTVMPVYIDERSDPEQNRYFWAYRVVIFNDGKRSVQVVSRHWIITDANGRTEEVRGRGVVGEQPILRPGDSFEYTSGCVLRTPRGTMHGTYEFVRNDASRFDAEIAPFDLRLPLTLN
jgi:ApaG protein